MTPDEAKQLQSQGEGQEIEFKDEAIKPGDLAETLVALANGNGGIVFVGVNDVGQPVGVSHSNSVRDLV